jgi:pimeloyl-ACP methyl ester carboxylesterase
MTKAFLALFAVIAIATSASAQTPQLVTEEVMVKSPDAGVEIFVRNKRPAAMTTFRPERTVLFVHGATYPAHTSFDLKLDGRSWMDYIASRGYDVYLLDIRGYGKSTRPKEMAEDAKNNPPIVRGRHCGEGHRHGGKFILTRRNIPRLNLLGWSWGTSLMATYTTQNAARLSASCSTRRRGSGRRRRWCRPAPARSAPTERLGRDQALARWLTGVPEDKKATLIPAGWFDAWADATFASDPEGAKMNPPVLRAPNGVMQDGAEFHGAGKPYYDPAQITVPTLLVLGEWDRDTPPYMAQTLFPLLVNAPGKRFVMLAEGTHTIMMEKNRLELFRAVQAFLDEAGGS